MPFGIYTEARNIAAALDASGLAAEAQALRDEIEAGSTGTEILMALRWHLERIAPSAGAAASLATRIRTLAAAIGARLDA